jgi:class 3 adenylate cyclase
MFCDLVGSTALSVRRDPEDLRDLIGAYHHAVAEVVRRFAGFVARYMGDGILIYFGYPHAHEDDAERAAHCALAVLEAVSGLNLAEELRAHRAGHRHSRRRRRGSRARCRRRDPEPRRATAEPGRAEHGSDR